MAGVRSYPLFKASITPVTSIGYWWQRDAQNELNSSRQMAYVLLCADIRVENPMASTGGCRTPRETPKKLNIVI